MIVKVTYPNTKIGIKNALQHKESINKFYNPYTQPFARAELLVTIKNTILYYNK